MPLRRRRGERRDDRGGRRRGGTGPRRQWWACAAVAVAIVVPLLRIAAQVKPLLFGDDGPSFIGESADGLGRNAHRAYSTSSRPLAAHRGEDGGTSSIDYEDEDDGDVQESARTARTEATISVGDEVPLHLKPFDHSFASGRPYLVVCDSVDNSLRPYFDGFTVVRLNKKEEPPPWNATAFLHGEHCKDNPYVKEAVRRREKSPFYAPAPEGDDSFPSSARRDDDDDDDDSGWVHGVHWPSFANNSTKYLRAIRDRPAILKVYGEVFWRAAYGKESCAEVDFTVYREVETLLPNCLQIHFVQGVSTIAHREEAVGVGYGALGFRGTTDIFRKKVAHPHKPKTVNYTKFCSFLVNYNSTHPGEITMGADDSRRCCANPELTLSSSLHV